MSKNSKMTLEMGSDFVRILDSLAKQKNVDRAEVIRRAVAVYYHFQGEMKEGRKVSITTAEDQVVKDVILP